MADSSGKAKEFALGNDFGDVAVTVNGVRVEVHTDGSILAYTNSSVDAYTNGPVKVHPAANDDAKAKAAPKPGDRMPDGTVYAGISPDTHKPMYAMPVDEPLTYTFKKAAVQADANNMTNALGHHDWRVPTKDELNMLWEN